MKKIVAIVILSPFLFFSKGFAQEKNKDVMLRKIFSILKNSDEAAFIKLFPDAATTRLIFVELFKVDSVEKEDREAVREYMNQVNDSSLQEEYSDDFRRITSKAEVLGFDWSKSSLVSYTMDSALVSDDGFTALKLNGKIYFKSGSRDFFMTYDDIIWIEKKGWYGVTIKRIADKARENEPDEFDSYPMVDSVGATRDTIRKVISEKANIPVTPKQPANDKPVKNKSNTPARKPE